MQMRQMGSEGPMVPVLGLGAWPIGGGMGKVEDDVAIATVRAAVDGGITLLDTAQAYRTSEATLGAALDDGYRDRCFLATKVSGDYSPSGIRSAMENSLRALRTDHVDLYQIHGPSSDYPIDASMETMLRLQEEGKTRHLGVSNYNAAQMAEALRTGRYHSNQVCYNMIDRWIEAEDAPYCEREGIGIMVHSPLAKGLLTGKYSSGYRFPEDDERSTIPRFQRGLLEDYIALADRLAEVAADIGITLVQLAIAWTMRLASVSCTLVGAKNPEQVAEHIGAAEVKLSADELERIEMILADTPEG